MPEACNFVKKETLVQAVSCEFSEIFKNSFITDHLRAIASVFIFSKVIIHNIRNFSVARTYFAFFIT